MFKKQKQNLRFASFEDVSLFLTKRAVFQEGASDVPKTPDGVDKVDKKAEKPEKTPEEAKKEREEKNKQKKEREATEKIQEEEELRTVDEQLVAVFEKTIPSPGLLKISKIFTKMKKQAESEKIKLILGAMESTKLEPKERKKIVKKSLKDMNPEDYTEFKKLARKFSADINLMRDIGRYAKEEETKTETKELKVLTGLMQDIGRYLDPKESKKIVKGREKLPSKFLTIKLPDGTTHEINEGWFIKAGKNEKGEDLVKLNTKISTPYDREKLSEEYEVKFDDETTYVVSKTRTR